MNIFIFFFSKYLVGVMYCSLEEAWGSDFNRNNQNTTNDNKENIEEKYLKNLPSYNGNNESTALSNVVPYQVKFPEQSKRNYLYDINSEESNENIDIDSLSDNDNDIDYIDKGRNINDATDYLNSKDYFLYKKYMDLAKKYKNKLKRKYKNFFENSDETDNVLESFNFKKSVTSNDYSGKDIVIITIIGIFIIFALDIFVKIGMKMRK